MFGSQALETAIGLVLMFFVIATAVSVLVEIVSRMLSKRGKDLEALITVMITGRPPSQQAAAAAAAYKTQAGEFITAFKGTSVYTALEAAAGESRTLFKRRTSARLPSYISAKSFADAVAELAAASESVDHLPAGLQKRLKPLVAEVGSDVTKLKAGVERWYDETMDRAGGAYKRWATWWIFGIGLVLVVVANANTVTVAEKLWRDPVTRQVVADSAAGVASNTSNRTGTCTDTASTTPTTVAQAAPSGGSAPEPTTTTSSTPPTSAAPPSVACQIKSVADATDQLHSLGLPIGWDKAATDGFRHFGGLVKNIVGLLLTAFLVMLGAPFWFDLLTKLVSLRSSGTKPDQAPNDPASATSQVIANASPVTIKGVAPVALGSATVPVREGAKIDFATAMYHAFGCGPLPTLPGPQAAPEPPPAPTG